MSQANLLGNKSLRPVVKRYLKSRLSIFRRIAVYIMSQFPQLYMDLIDQLLNQTKNLDDIHMKHEIRGLLRRDFNLLRKSTQDFIINWMDKGPDTRRWMTWQTKESGKRPSKELTQEFIDQWKIERYSLIEGYLPDKKEIIDQLKKKHTVPPQAEFASWQEREIGGPESPFNAEVLSEATPKVLSAILKLPLTLRSRDLVYGYTGLFLAFQKLVETSPTKHDYATILKGPGINPEFIVNYFRGLESIWPQGVLVWTDEIHSLAEIVASRGEGTKFWTLNEQTRMRLNLGRLIETVVSNKPKTEQVSSDAFLETLGKMKRLFLAMLEDPLPLDDDLMSSQNKKLEWQSQSLNTWKGQTLRSLIRYAIHYAQGKNLQDPKARMEDDVKEALRKLIENSSEPFIKGVFGMYLANLWYLDAEWIRRELPHVFPSNDKSGYLAAWQGYTTSHGVYREIYESLKTNYRQAILALRRSMKAENLEAERFTQHLALVCWREWEDFNDSASNISLFFKKAPVKMRVSFIRYIGLGLQEMKKAEQLTLDNPAWKSASKFWEWRTKFYKPGNIIKPYEDEMASFLTWWVPNIPGTVVDNYPLLYETLRKCRSEFVGGEIINYLTSFSRTNPVETLELLSAFYLNPSERIRFGYHAQKVHKIMEDGLQAGSHSAELATILADKLGKCGIFSYKDIWDIGHVSISSAHIEQGEARSL